jgi:hypothetical protein
MLSPDQQRTNVYGIVGTDERKSHQRACRFKRSSTDYIIIHIPCQESLLFVFLFSRFVTLQLFSKHVTP